MKRLCGSNIGGHRSGAAARCTRTSQTYPEAHSQAIPAWPATRKYERSFTQIRLSATGSRFQGSPRPRRALQKASVGPGPVALAKPKVLVCRQAQEPAQQGHLANKQVLNVFFHPQQMKWISATCRVTRSAAQTWLLDQRKFLKLEQHNAL